DLRASGGIARVHVGYSLSFLIFELGFTGKTTDFSEENAVPSYDNWEIGSDFSVYINAWDVLEIRPYIEFSYAWFRDQFDLQDDGTLLRQEDDLQLLKFNYGADVRLDIGLIEAEARVYSLRQDDSAAGFNRYWQYGLRGALDLNLYEPLRITFGLDAWHREYDDRVDVDSLDPDSTVKTTFERYAMLWTEVAYNVYSFLYLGGRYSYSRRISDVNAAGYAVHTATLFVELNF
ncbi:MAG: hypothetical protein KJ044_13335, partial [Planctomycetes bacterium]|nr:hypothetical protein [Planctomycetota bacterium]